VNFFVHLRNFFVCDILITGVGEQKSSLTYRLHLFNIGKLLMGIIMKELVLLIKY